MEVYYLHHPFDAQKIDPSPKVLAMGFFDGLHVGHREVIAKAKALAESRGLKLAVLTYDHHPSIVFEQHTERMKYLTTLPRKLELLSSLGVDQTYVVNFTAQYAQQTPQEFVDNYIVGLHSQVAVAGFDHTYGSKDANADMAHLKDYAHGRFEIVEIPKQEVLGHESASRYSRALLDAGDVDELRAFLTIPYETTGVVVHGEARGRQMGFPTANIETPADERLPGVGVYAVEMKIGETWYPGMASIGYNVTFGSDRPKTVEIYLFDFAHNIYGEQVKVRWHHYLRGEEKFNGMDDLKKQLQQDEADIRAYFSEVL
ncbi:riboflavin kinase/FMN adenylyltransferase [Weissella uvarum]|uniref:riboflavin biosynthesis protein RibF n=1 Tax=Weissella uvarum TaxID=1479233 RepID=UPI0019606770|nr:riboflavin biosynthesis protein RibF [Weissella uvarum]MBM7617569.1 riboflavin kinase/FMN adenylyltransferase [Weissella uvarum]MCM0595549.1 riboflavin biosynthesis protein RibF [Weissella uvarum]